jgi:hypothetical protein
LATLQLSKFQLGVAVIGIALLVRLSVGAIVPDYVGTVVPKVVGTVVPEVVASVTSVLPAQN